MTISTNKVSILINDQLPRFIREEHPIFVEFLQKYYEFLEQPSNPIYELKKFQDNYDIDATRESLLKYFKSKILPSFPEETALSTERIIKASRDFYAKKGTPESFKFLFRVLYNKDLDIFFPKLQILKASDGKWVQPQSIRLSITNTNINIKLLEKRKAYGSLSKASCVVESAYLRIDTSSNTEILELFISNINRFFQNGEDLVINYLDDDGISQTFSAKIIGAISNITPNPSYRGTQYNTGDPVVISGGLDKTLPTTRKAVAHVGNVSTGSIDAINVLDGGFGFSTYSTLIDISTDTGSGTLLEVDSVDTGNAIPIRVYTGSIYNHRDTLLSGTPFTTMASPPRNISNTVSDILNLQYNDLSISPIKTIMVESSGSFYKDTPSFDAISLYDTDASGTIITTSLLNYDNVAATVVLSHVGVSSVDDYYTNWLLHVGNQARSIIRYDGATNKAYLNRKFESNILDSNISDFGSTLDSRCNIKGLGKIAKIKISAGGVGYSASDTLTFVGDGYGASATISVTGSGTISAVTLHDYETSSTNFTGEGYRNPPTITINSSGGSGAILTPILLGDGESLSSVSGRVGQIRDIIVDDRGVGYGTTPIVSLKIMDIKISPLSENDHIIDGDIIYQGSNVNTASFYSTVDSYDTANSIVRVFNYSGTPTQSSNLVVYKSSTETINTTIVPVIINGSPALFRKYGDGKAKANVSFSNGIIKYNGYYMNTDGQVSSDKKLQGSNKYHNFSYGIQSDIQYSEYSKSILDIVHPAGTKLLPVYTRQINKKVNEHSTINVHIEVVNSNTSISNCNIAYGSTSVVTYSGDTLTSVAAANDIIRIEHSGIIFNKVITSVVDNNHLTIESPCAVFGDGKLYVNAMNASVVMSSNDYPVLNTTTPISTVTSVGLGPTHSFTRAGTGFGGSIGGTANNQLYIGTPTPTLGGIVAGMYIHDTTNLIGANVYVVEYVSSGSYWQLSRDVGQPVSSTTIYAQAADYVDNNVYITRCGEAGSVYNPLTNVVGSSSLPVTGVLWNASGWTTLTDVKTRTYYTTITAATGDTSVNTPNYDLVMHDTINDKYYKVKFTSWQSGVGTSSGSFSYTRNLLNIQYDNSDRMTFNVGSSYITANLTTGSGNTTSTVNINTSNYMANTSDYYTGMTLQVLNSTVQPNTSTIVEYNGVTKIAYLSPALGVAPTATSNIAIYGNGLVTKSVIGVTGNTITLNTSSGIVYTKNNVSYNVSSKINAENYEIIKTNYIPD